MLTCITTASLTSAVHIHLHCTVLCKNLVSDSAEWISHVIAVIPSSHHHPPVLLCRITLLRLKPYMFEPDASDELRVKEPLDSFLGKFKKVPAAV